MALTFYLVDTKGCKRCNTTQPSENILSPYDRLVMCSDFEFCPYCGRYLNRAEYQNYKAHLAESEVIR